MIHPNKHVIKIFFDTQFVYGVVVSQGPWGKITVRDFVIVDFFLLLLLLSASSHHRVISVDSILLLTSVSSDSNCLASHSLVKLICVAYNIFQFKPPGTSTLIKNTCNFLLNLCTSK
jgi:hypothetical protein